MSLTNSQRIAIEDAINDYAEARADAAAIGIPLPWREGEAGRKWDHLQQLLDELQATAPKRSREGKFAHA